MANSQEAGNESGNDWWGWLGDIVETSVVGKRKGKSYKCVQYGHYADLLALEAIFSCPELTEMKNRWLSRLGSDVEDLHARVFDSLFPPPEVSSQFSHPDFL